MSRIDARRLLIVLLLAALFPTALAGADLLSGDALSPTEANYRTETVRIGAFEKPTSGTAIEYYPLTYQVSYAYSNARFLEYTVSRGAQVKAGDVLARFTMVGSNAELERKKLALTRAEEAAERELEAIDERLDLARTTVPETADKLEREKLALALRRLELEREQCAARQQYELDNLRRAVEETETAQTLDTLVAPVDGVVTNLVGKDVDEAILPGEAMVTLLCSTDVMLLRMENITGTFRYNMPVTVTAGPGKNRVELTGRIIAADDVIAENRRSGQAFILLDPYEGDVKLSNLKVNGASIWVDNVPLISRRAITLENGKQYVTKLADGMVQKRYVNVGVSGSTDIWVLQGVSEGETLVLD